MAFFVRRLIAVMLACTCAGAVVAVRAAESQRPAPAGSNVLTLDVFVRSDSKHSQDAAEFAGQLARQRRGLRVVVHDVVSNPAARRQFWSLCQKFSAKKPGLPAFFACNRARFGFADASTSGRAIEDLFTIRAFVREGCQHCRDAKRFLAGLARRWPAVRVETLDVVADRAAERRMSDAASQYRSQVTALPAIELCGRFVVGYQSDATTGAEIERILRDASLPSRGLRAQHQGADEAAGRPRAAVHPGARRSVLFVGLQASQPAADGSAYADEPPLPPVAEEETTVVAPPSPAPPEGIEIPGWGMLSVGELGLPAFTFVIGLIDGFNPCAMWVLVFLLSVLVNVRDRVKILAIAGTFVVISGLAYFAFMAAWLNVFLLVGYMRPLQVALGALAVIIGIINVKDFVALKRGISLSIPEFAKEGIYARVRQIVVAKYLGAAVAMAVVLAISVNIVELLCTAGLPALYTQILMMQRLPAWQNYAYLLLYNTAYMLDDSLMLGIFIVTLSHRKIQEREGRWLKLASGLVILALGLVMLFKPRWLELAGLGQAS